MPFFQAAAPTGWTQVATQNNKGIRIVSGTGGGTGGTIAFSTLFSPTATYSGSINITSGQVGDTTLLTSQAPSLSGGWNSAGLAFSFPFGTGFSQQPNFSNLNGDGQGSNNYKQILELNYGSSAVHTHSLAGAAAVGNFTSNFDLQYIDMILASKN
jgi:hypothetical protein